ncbi:MAG: hypothetical protein JRI86_09745, partial [Deltaproteobacteria bacterium]|nr:hypothetical protein [Deltaproteobacteria bacterium]
MTFRLHHIITCIFFLVFLVLLGSQNVFSETPDYGDNFAKADSISENQTLDGRFSKSNDWDYFEVTLSEAGTLLVYTTYVSPDNIDTYGHLYDGAETPITFNDDAGVGLNFRIEKVLPSGTYYIAMHEYLEDDTGDYTLHVEFTPGITTYSINASAGLGGVISPSGVVSINSGDSQIFTITPDTCFEINDVEVDGSSAGAVTTYEFTDVTSDHAISATFALDTLASATITASAGANGAISPSGSVAVTCNQDQTFLINPDSNYAVEDVLVDGASVGSVRSYTFSPTLSNHTIEVSFVADDHGGRCAAATSVGTTSTTAGIIQSSGSWVDKDFFEVNITGRGSLLVSTSSSIDTKGILYDSGCTILAQDDDAGAVNNFEIKYGVDTGTYYIAVRHAYPDQTGSYDLNVEFEADDHGEVCASATAISCNTSTSGKIQSAVGWEDWDFFELTLADTTLVTVDTDSSIDTYGYIYDSGCAVLAQDQDSGTDLNFSIEQALAAGTYYIAVRHHDADSYGSYTLNVGCDIFHTITASADAGGSITPVGTTEVREGDDETFTITTNSPSISIDDVLVDGGSVGGVTTYTFNNVTSDHTISVSFATPPGYCVDISDVPLDVRRHAPPPNIMFMIDDGGSMDFEFMTVEDNNLFEAGNFSMNYIFDLSDRVYKTGSRSRVLTGDDRMLWRSQWQEHNKMYYNPEIDYVPWVTLSNADPDNPRSKPDEITPTLNMSGTFHSFSDALGGIIDDESSAFSVSSGTTVIVDNTDPEFTISGTWISVAGSGGYNDNFYRTDVSGAYAATWRPVIPATAEYTVYARWAANSKNSTAVPYRIQHSGGIDAVIVDQTQNDEEWVAIGTYYFDAGTFDYVEITYTSSGTDDLVCADAVKFVPTDAWDWATHSDAYNSKYWTIEQDGNYTATWDLTGIPDGDYYAYAMWYATVDRSTSVPYTVTNSSGSNTYTVDQTANSGSWVQLGGSHTFSGGSGNISINLTGYDISADGTICADAVKLISTTASTVDIKNSHYYVWSDTEDKPYLVILDSDVSYYEVNDTDGDYEVESGELWLSLS